MNTNDTIKLQYQLSNGSWVDCEDRTDHFLALCAENNGPDEDGNIVPRFRATRDLTLEEVITALNTGASLRNDVSEWYSKCRLAIAPATPRPSMKHRFTCRHCGEHRDTTIAGRCDDCEA